MTSTTEQTETAPETKATKKASRGARRANVAPTKGKVSKKGHAEEESAPERAKRRPGGRFMMAGNPTPERSETFLNFSSRSSCEIAPSC
jgi:hypothetical protein